MPLTAPKRYRTRLSRLWGITFLQRSSRKLNKPECFLLWLMGKRTLPTKKTCLLSSAMSTLQRIFESSLLVTASVCGDETTGNAIRVLIINLVRDLGLTMDNCRGQSYDGAGNMAGRYVGASTLIQHQFPKAIYVHCMNHRLNLCVADTCSLAMVQDMMGTVRKLSEFFRNSPKRQYHLVVKIKELLTDSNHRILIDFCRTRWAAKRRNGHS